MKKNICLPLVILFVLLSCDPPIWTYEILHIKNESPDTIDVYWSIKYPDTTFSRRDAKGIVYLTPYETDGLFFSGTGNEMEYYRGHYFNEHPVWQLFFVKKNVLDKFPDDTIRKYNLIESRMEITRPMMIKNNWTIIYKSNNKD